MSRTVGGIVLAAGESSRFGTENKLLAPVEGTPMIRRVAETAVRSSLDGVVAVLGHEARDVAAALSGTGIETRSNSAYADGQSTSIRQGIAIARRSDWDGAMVLLGDMPFVAPATIDRLVAAYRSGRGTLIAPRHDGQRGNPVVFDRQYFDRLDAVAGDQGGRHLVDTSPDTVLLDVDDSGVLRDIDTPDDL